MSAFTEIDLARLPQPTIIEPADAEALFQQMKDRAISLDPDLAPYLALESEPMTKVLQVCAYYRALDRAEFNDGARGLMLAFATGSQLDQLGANWGVERLVIQEADDTQNPPILELLETDVRLRRRIQLSIEAHTTTGTAGALTYFALTASPDVRDAYAYSTEPGNATLVVLSDIGDGTADANLLSAVHAAVAAADRRTLGVVPDVVSASIVGFQVVAEVTTLAGPGAATVLATSEANLASYVDAQRGIGRDITLSGITAALHGEGVHKVVITSPAADLTIAETEAASMTAAPVITHGGIDA